MKRAHEEGEEEDDLKCVAPIKKPRTALDPPSPTRLHPLDKLWYFVALDESLASGYIWDPQTAVNPLDSAEAIWNAHETMGDAAFATALAKLAAEAAADDTKILGLGPTERGTWTRFEKKKSLLDAGRVLFYSSAAKK